MGHHCRIINGARFQFGKDPSKLTAEEIKVLSEFADFVRTVPKEKPQVKNVKTISHNDRNRKR